MIRDQLVKDVADWFSSEMWRNFVKGLSPDDTVYHAHIYAESCLDPKTLAKVCEGYFKNSGKPLQRKIKFLGHGNGMTNIYYMQPEGKAHFELFLKHNPDRILSPMPEQYTRSGKVYEYWDKEYMENHYKKYDLKIPDEDDVLKIKEYFNSDAWKHIYAVARNKSTVHSHAVVETNLHPEYIIKYGREALERRHWKVARAVSVVWDFFGYDQCKLTYLLSEPEIVLELELQYEPYEAFRLGPVPVIDIITEDDIEKTMKGLDYSYISKEEIEAILQRIVY